MCEGASEQESEHEREQEMRKRRRKRERESVYVCDVERNVWFEEGDIEGERASEGGRSVCEVKVK